MQCKNKWSIFFLLSWSFLVVSISLWFADPDVFWHLKVGEWIVSNNAIPRYDIYSWSVYGEPWTAHQWLWEVILYTVHEYFGLLGMWALAFVMGVTSGAFIRAGLKASGVSENVATLAGGLGILLLIGWFKPWPQVGMYALFSAYLYLSLRNKWGPIEAIYTALLGLVWANIHSTAVMLPLLLFAEICYKLLFKRNDLADMRWRLAAVASAGIATLLNPHGLGLWAYAFGQGLSTSIYREIIQSWMPYHFGFNSLSFIFFIGMIILFIAVRQGKEKDLEFLRAAGFWAFALMSRIYSPLAILSTAALAGKIKFELSSRFIKILAFIYLLAGLINLPLNGVPSDLEQVAKENNYPVAAVEYIKNEGLEKIYNDHGWGGYLLWKEIPVYIDGRNDVYADIIEEFININQLEQPVGKTIKETGAKTVLTRINGRLDVSLRESEWWEEVYREDIAVIYVKATLHNKF